MGGGYCLNALLQDSHYHLAGNCWKQNESLIWPSQGSFYIVLLFLKFFSWSVIGANKLYSNNKAMHLFYVPNYGAHYRDPTCLNNTNLRQGLVSGISMLLLRGLQGSDPR